MDADPDDKKDVRRPMNAFLIFCKRHRSMVRERNSHLDNRSVTRILGDLWANIGEEEKNQYIELAKQYKDAFMKANPDYKWHNPERMPQLKPANERVPSASTGIAEDGPIVPGKLADPSNMGGLSMLMEGNQIKNNQFGAYKEPDQGLKSVNKPLLTASSFCPWISKQELEDERKLIIDEGEVKQENKTSVASNFSTLKQELAKKEPQLQMQLSNPDQDEKNPGDPDDAVYSYGKVVMDHIIDKLYLSTIKNMGQENKNVMNTLPSKISPQPVVTEVLKPQSTMPVGLPPSQGRKSYHTSIAVKNLLEFTRRAAAREEANLKNSGIMKYVKQEPEDKCVSETKQKLKDFCLKKEGRPKIVGGNDNCESDVKEFKRKRCYSESCAEIYRNQEKRMKLQSEQCEDTRKLIGPANDDDNQPTRKSRRRNRGQRYQELINEGIIQPSKARLAAMKTDTVIKNISFREMFFSKRPEELGDDVLSVYPRQIRKRTMSESEKNRTAFDESNRYRTGDFDLEAHIKTLPACSLEKVVRPKRTVGKSSLSESDSSAAEPSEQQPEMKLTAHLKTKPSTNNVPVVGSRKRKARKHSITHLLPVKDAQNPEVAATTLSGIIKMDCQKPGIPSVKQTKDTVKNSVTSIQSMEQCDNKTVKDCDSNDAENITDKHDNERVVTKEPTYNLTNNNSAKIEHSDSISNTDSTLCNQKFTKLKNNFIPFTSDSTICDNTCDNSAVSIEKSDSFNSHHFKDQDENSNDPIYCPNGNRNNLLSNLSENSDINNDSVTMVTAVSVSVPMTTPDICVSDNMVESVPGSLHLNLDSNISQCDITSSSVTMTTLQPSLTCLC